MCYFLTEKNEVEANLNNGDICEFDPHRHAGHLFLTKLRELITGAVRALHDLILFPASYLQPVYLAYHHTL